MLRSETNKRGRGPARYRRVLRKWAIAVVLLALLIVPAGAFGGEYVIGEGDGLMISVWGEKDLSSAVKVRPDGKITLPAVGEIAAAGMTPAELKVHLMRHLRGVVRNPSVSVAVTEATNNKVYVFGGGIGSGVFSLTHHTTLLQLLCQAGQNSSDQKQKDVLTESVQNADLRDAYVLRKGKIIRKDFYDLFINAKLSDDMVMEPNDALFIPAFKDRNVYVMGAVTTPKAISYRDGLTVVEAILEAGGFTKFASRNSTYIYRKDGEKDDEIRVRVKDLINDGDLRQNTRLRPGDYVVVSESLF